MIENPYVRYICNISSFGFHVCINVSQTVNCTMLYYVILTYFSIYITANSNLPIFSVTASFCQQELFRFDHLNRALPVRVWTLRHAPVSISKCSRFISAQVTKSKVFIVKVTVKYTISRALEIRDLKFKILIVVSLQEKWC